MAFVEMKDVYKRYRTGEIVTAASDGINFTIEKGEFAIIVGPSGAGKTTVLNILGGMDTADEGQVLVDGNDIVQYTPKQLVGYRRHDIGFVFQFYNLVQNLTALENVELAAQMCHNPHPGSGGPGRPWGWATGWITFRRSFPAASSSGFPSRGRWPKRPKLLLCDEPTGALTTITGKQILSLLQSACREGGMTVIVVTHNTAITPMADRVITIRNSKVASNIYNPHPADIATIEW